MGLPIIIQEFIHGTEFNVTDWATAKEKPSPRCLCASSTLLIGQTWGGISIADEKMLEMTRKFYGTRNGGEVRTGTDEEQGRDLYLLEINPRLPAWIILQ